MDMFGNMKISRLGNVKKLPSPAGGTILNNNK